MTAGITPTAAPNPVVSVVMVTYGGEQWIPRALAALAEHTQVPYEVVIVDNASPAPTRELLASLKGPGGPTVVFNEANVGFGPGCNQGVLHARAPWVCLLNSDAFVEPGWLPPLLEVLEQDPQAGAAVPCLLHLDGTLQEAGGVVGCDASTRALGDGARAEELEYRFRRYVDYGSAACLLMRRSVFARIGGFDPAYPLGYCEDVDLCFSLRELGLRTVYEPRSRVRHVRWGSSSRTEAEQRVFANQPILLARWRERLSGRPAFGEPPVSAHELLSARDADCLDRILVLGESVEPGSFSPRAAWLAGVIARAWPDARVTLLLPGAAVDARVTPLLHRGVEVVCDRQADAWLAARRFHYSAVVLTGAACFERNDPVISATQPQAARVFDLPALGHRSAEHLTTWWPEPGPGAEGGAEAGPAGMLAGRLRSLEAWGVESADAVLCGSREGLWFARSVDPQTPAYLVREPALGMRPGRGGFADRSGFVASGSLPAGPLAARRGVHGRATLLGPVRAIGQALAGLGHESPVAFRDDVAILAGPPHGFDAAADPARVLLLPPPFLAGVPAALLAQGTPFVAWRGAAEGLELGDLEPLLVADDVAGFASRAWELHRDRALWEEVSTGLARLAGLQARRSDPLEALWGALAHCGVGSPVVADLA